MGVHPDSEDVATRSDPAKPIDLYDVFEPTYHEAAFRCKDVNLGHLIFDYEEWDMMCGHELGTSRHNASDPLTLMYRSLGMSLTFDQFYMLQLHFDCFNQVMRICQLSAPLL